MAIFPGSNATDSDLYVAVNYPVNQSTLNGAINNSVTTIPLLSTANFPSTGGLVTIDTELISYTGVSGGNLTGCTRGTGGTTAVSHLTATPVVATAAAAHHNLLKDEIEQIETYLINNLGSGSQPLSIGNRVLQSNGSGKITESGVTSTTLAFLDATSSIQTQLNAKLGTTLTSADILVGNGSNVATAVALSGDATLSNSGALTLATVNSNVGSFTNANITVNAKGLITAASNGTAGGVTGVKVTGGSVETGTIILNPGSNITITDSPAGTFTIAASGGSFTAGNLTDAGTDGITITGGTNAVNGSGTSISQHVADTTHNGYLSSTDWNTFNGKQPSLGTLTAHDVLVGAGGSSITLVAPGASGTLFISQGVSADPSFNAMSGDATITNTGALTLATVNSNTGSFGSSTAIPNFTVNGKGLITAAGTNAVIAPAGTLTGTTLASNVVTSSLTTVGTISTGTWNGTIITPSFGGTGVANLTAHNVIIGEGASNVAFAAPGTAGNLLISQGASADPSFNAMSGDATISSSGALTLATVSVAKGGTGATSFTAYAPIAGGTTSTGALQSASSGMSNVGYVLTSTGTGSLPTWQASAATATFPISNSGTVDVRLARIAASVLELDNGTSGIFADLTLATSTHNSLATPVISSVTTSGVTGSTTYGYQVVAVYPDGTYSAPSAQVTVATGNGTLQVGGYNIIAFGLVSGAVSYNIYRIVGTPIVTGPGLAATGVTSSPYNDQGTTVSSNKTTNPGNNTGLVLFGNAGNSVDTGLDRESAGVVGAIGGYGNYLGQIKAGVHRAVQLAAPATPTVTTSGTTGSTTWGYKVVAKLADGTTTAASTQGTTGSGNGNATLTGSNFQVIKWAMIPFATSYDIYRTSAPGTPSSTGLIGTFTTPTTGDFSGNTGATMFSFNDTGLAGDSSTAPSVNSTGSLELTDASTNLITLVAPASVTSYSLYLPSAQGGANTTIVNDGSGNLSFAKIVEANITAGTITNTSINASAAIAFSKMAALTIKSFVYSDASGVIAATANPTNGQLLIGSTGNIPAVATLTQTANQVLVTNGAGTITLSTPQNIHTAATPTFASLTLTNATNQLILSGPTRTATISAVQPATSSRTYTFPDLSGNYNVVGDAGTQTIGGSKTFSSALTINPTTNQLVLGVTNTTTINSTAPASSRTYTIPDAGGNANFVLDAGNYTIGGTWTFSNALTLSSPLTVPNGGTGLSTLTTAYGVVCAGTTATGNLQNAGAGTTGQFLQSNGASALPSFNTVDLFTNNLQPAQNETIPANNCSYVGPYYKIAVGNLLTVGTGGYFFITEGVSGGVSAPVTVPNGGTGLTSTTAYGVITGGTTSTGAFQNTGVGTSGQVLTSNGAGQLPTWGQNGYNNGTVKLTAQTGLVGPTTILTTPNDGAKHLYRYNAYMVCTGTGTMSLDHQVKYTDAAQAQTVSGLMTMQSANGFATASGGTGHVTGTVGVFQMAVFTFEAEPNTAIQYATTGSISSGTYNLHIMLEQLF